jgi:membrane protease YdiL (CAAX protease family)
MAQVAAAPTKTTVASENSKARILAEIALTYGLILLVIWTPRPAQRYLWIVAAASVVFVTWISYEGRQAMGLRAAGFARALWIVAAALFLSAAAILVAAHFGTLHLPAGVAAFFATYCAYAIWSGVQQFLLQGVFLLRFLKLIPNPRLAALTAAALFAAAHLPNPILTPITFVWGLAACLLFLHYRNVYPLALAHAILGITVAMTIPGPVDHNMRVGLGYITYGHQRHGRLPYPLEHPLPKP